jgi:hypothetical protein
MDNISPRREFLANAGKLCACSCVGAMFAGFQNVLGDEAVKDSTSAQPKTRDQERIAFAEGWLKRFFEVFDANLDEPTRRKIMMANGKSCYLTWIKDTKQEIKPVGFERFTNWIKTQVTDGSYSVDGKTIYFQYLYAAETGQAAPESHCLCPMVETKPEGLSATYCICSVGYVKQMHEMYLGQPVEVELVDSVLRGGPRCKFKITVV